MVVSDLAFSFVVQINFRNNDRMRQKVDFAPCDKIFNSLQMGSKSTLLSSFGAIKSHLSNLKWLLLGSRALVNEVENWPDVMWYYAVPFRRRTLTIRFRKQYALLVPRNYVFEAVAETLLLNVYGFEKGMRTVVDVGASIGDFVLLASKSKTAIVYAYEPNLEAFQYMKRNVD